MGGAFAEAPLDSGLDSGEEPLPPDQAFKLSTKLIDADLIHAEWEIADGYYLYRDKFKFISNTPGITLEPASFPAGKKKKDEHFGEVETYRHLVGIDIPLKRSGDASKLDLTLISQGCADMGLCYPAQKQNVSFDLPPMPALSSTDNSGALGALKKFGQDLGLSNNNEDFLPVDKAFAFSAAVENGNQLIASWEIADGYYLYRDKFKFSLKNADGIEFGDITMPPGKEKVDESFGKMVVYMHNVDIALPLKRSALEAKDITLVAKYQGCAEKGLCYPPQTREMPLSLPAGQALATAMSNTPASGSAASTGADAANDVISEQDQAAALLKDGNTLFMILSFFGFGLLLAFTPCVFPMIPILSSIIVGQGSDVSTKKAFLMSLVYVLAMAVTYAIAGVIAGLSGANLQAAFQNPWILSSFAAVFVLLAMSMFGFYDIQMPSFIQSRLTEISNRQQGGTLVGVGIMGFLSALIVGPCVAAPLAGALIYISQTKDWMLGGIALFSLGLGMGAPLLAIGTSAGELLPRAGKWMDAVKSVFGVVMLAVAIWMLERILPGQVTMILWALLLIVSAIYLGALDAVKEGASGWSKLWKGLGVSSLIYGVILAIGAATGSSDPLLPLQKLGMGGGGTAAVAEQKVAFQRIKGPQELDSALQQASAQGKMAMLDFYADWCVSCKEVEKYTFSDPTVQGELRKMMLLQADITDGDEQDQALLSKFGVVGPPTVMFFDSKGNEIKKHRIVGETELEKDKFLARLSKIQQ